MTIEQISKCPRCHREIITARRDDGSIESDYRGKDGRCFDCTFAKAADADAAKPSRRRPHGAAIAGALIGWWLLIAQVPPHQRPAFYQGKPTALTHLQTIGDFGPGQLGQLNCGAMAKTLLVSSSNLVAFACQCDDEPASCNQNNLAPLD